VEDILDTGLTLSYLRKLFVQQHPKSLRIATLLDSLLGALKNRRRLCGLFHSNLFVIGYGMDYAERYRNLPDICVMPAANRSSRSAPDASFGRLKNPFRPRASNQWVIWSWSREALYSSPGECVPGNAF